MQTPEEFTNTAEKRLCLALLASANVSVIPNLMQLIIDYRAEIKRECAERAITWLKTLHHEPEPGLPWSGKIKRMQELQICTLRATIIGEEE